MTVDGQNPALTSLVHTKEFAPPTSLGKRKIKPRKIRAGIWGAVDRNQGRTRGRLDLKKADSQYLGKLLRQAASGIYGEEVQRCATQLWLEVGQTEEGERWRARPFSTCKRRWCPVCEWRKSRERLMFALHNWPVLVPDEAAVMLRFLTLTVKSCSRKTCRKQSI